jgi:hypothetical protein
MYSNEKVDFIRVVGVVIFVLLIWLFSVLAILAMGGGL